MLCATPPCLAAIATYSSAKVTRRHYSRDGRCRRLGLVIIGLILARIFGWLWMDSLAVCHRRLHYRQWCYGLIRLVRRAIKADGDHVADLHLWRLGPGHPAAIISAASHAPREPRDIRNRLAAIPSPSHVTVGVERTV